MTPTEPMTCEAHPTKFQVKVRRGEGSQVLESRERQVHTSASSGDPGYAPCSYVVYTVPLFLD